MMINHLKSVTADITKHFLLLGNKKINAITLLSSIPYTKRILRCSMRKNCMLLYMQNNFRIPWITKRDLIMTVTSS